MKAHIRCLVIVVFYGLSVSVSWSAPLPLDHLSRLPSGDFRLDSGRIFRLQSENEEQRIITGTDINPSSRLFSIAMNSEVAPLKMQFYEGNDTGGAYY